MSCGQVLGLFEEMGDRYSFEGTRTVVISVLVVAEELSDIILIFLYTKAVLYTKVY